MITHPEIADSRWKVLFRVTAVASLVMVALVIIQSAVYVVFPPPSTVEGYFTLFQKNWFIGLLDLDLIYLVNSAIMILIYLALYVALKRTSPSLVTIALALSLVSLTAFYASNTSFEMLSLSSQYAAALTDAERAVLLSAGQSMLAIYGGTAFDVYYILSAVALLLFSFVMLQSRVFSKLNAYLGIVAGVLMLVPSTAGTIGLYFAFGSLIPWVIWLFPFSRTLFRLANGAVSAEVKQVE